MRVVSERFIKSVDLKAIIWVFFFVLISISSFAQKKQKKQLENADLLFYQKQYREAGIAYLKIYEKNKDRSLLLKIGDSYFSEKNYIQSQKYYTTYFGDTLYEDIPQYRNYAISAKENGNIPLVVRLNKVIYEKTQDQNARTIYENYRLYTDSLSFVRSYDLDSNYFCIALDATYAIDSLAAPLFYLWDFGEGKTKEGISVENCFQSAGEYKVVLSVMDRQTGYTRKNDTTLTILLEEQPVKFISPKIGRRYFFLDFDASQISLPAYQIIDYIWDMGTGETLTGKKIKYKFNESANYTVRLTLLTKNIFSQKRELFTAYRTISVRENYEMPSKKFSDDRDKAK